MRDRMLHTQATQLPRTRFIEEVVARHEAAVRAHVARLAPAPDLVDDLAQEVFVVAFEKYAGFDPSRDPLPWLLGISRNLCRNAWRRHRRGFFRHPLEMALERAALEARAECEEDPPDRLAALRGCLSELPERHRRLVHLRHDLGWPVDRMARQLGRSAGAVANLLLRVRRTLRACVERRLRSPS